MLLFFEWYILEFIIIIIELNEIIVFISLNCVQVSNFLKVCMRRLRIGNLRNGFAFLVLSEISKFC